jgi:riboflavin synthase
MFTGLIREVAKVNSFNNQKLNIKSNLNPKIGDSIAINGVCLTVTKSEKDYFEVFVAKETASIIPKDKFLNKVHIEPAMSLGDRLEGHILQGHIDTIGKVIKINKEQNGVDFFIEVEEKFIQYIIPKGSIAIDGVSLTINKVFQNSFSVTVIPHTMENTLIKTYKIGTLVNIETDMFARYIAHILKHQKEFKNSLTWSEIDNISLLY